MLLPQALLSLVYGKGQYIFCGDVQQLPPVILGPQPAEEAAVPSHSILAHCWPPTARSAGAAQRNVSAEPGAVPVAQPALVSGRLASGARHRPRHAWPSQPWLQPDLVDAILAPERPVTLVLAEHTTDHQRSLLEVEIVATLAARLLLDYGIAAERLAILAPHRAQNSAIAQRLAQLLAQRGAARRCR